MRILIHVDGTSLSEQAVALGAGLAQAAGARVTLLGAARESGADLALVQAAQERVQRLLPAPAEWKTSPLRGAQAILAELAQGGYDLVVAGSRGRRGWQRMAFGSVAGRLARYAPVPVLIVKGPPRQGLRRVLACTGAGERGEQVGRWGGKIAGWLDAELVVLHVMSQLALSDRAPLDPLLDSAEDAIADGTREGQHLARELELAAAEAAGVGGAPLMARPRLRHGLVLDEIIAEANEGDYDLVIIGAHRAPDASEGLARVKAFLLEDVADEIISNIWRPVLVVKGGG